MVETKDAKARVLLTKQNLFSARLSPVNPRVNFIELFFFSRLLICIKLTLLLGSNRREGDLGGIEASRLKKGRSRSGGGVEAKKGCGEKMSHGADSGGPVGSALGLYVTIERGSRRRGSAGSSPASTWPTACPA